MNSLVLFKKTLQDKGYSSTRARLAVFNLLLEAPGPVSMHELIDGSRGKADRVSVYRTVELFEQLGISQRINIGWKYKLELSEMFLDHHHHMTCLTCGRITPIKDEPQFEAMLQKIARTNGFVVTMHQLEMQGTCSDCAA